jgi:glycosyltransferase involved in cell wall biosynthesis
LMTEHATIIILYGPTWDAPSQVSKQHLARHWAQQGHRVLYVEAPFHPLSLASRPREVGRLWQRYIGGPKQVETNLWVQAYPVLFPYRAGWPLVGTDWMVRLNQALVRPQLTILCRRLGFHRPLVLVGTATALPLLDALEPSLVLYHCSDDYTRQSTFPTSFRELERDLITCCDLVICTSEALRQAKAHLHPHTYAVANGAQVVHFARTQAPNTPVAQELRDLPRPIVGYIGNVFQWLDQEMIAYAARERSEWSFVFVGPITTDVNQLQVLLNVHFLGPRPYDDLPSYLKGFDVTTVPFIFHDVTLRASPIKFYEYLASGVPLVASRLPDFESFAHLVGLVTTPDEFVAALEDAIAHDTLEKRQARMAEAQNHSWEARFAQIDRLIEEALAQKKEREQRSKESRMQGRQSA